jgi:azobenzene reductase
MKITIVSGTVREGRKSHDVALYLNDLLRLKGVDVTLVDLKVFNFPLLEYTFPNHPNPTTEMKELQQIFEVTDGFILVSPEYNGGPTAVLKNTLDYFKKEYSKKVMGVCTVSAGKLGGIRAACVLQQMVLSYGSYPIPQLLTVANVQSVFDEKGVLVDGAFEKSASNFLDSLLWLTEAVIDKLTKN